jgi:hypothetical protein
MINNIKKPFFIQNNLNQEKTNKIQTPFKGKVPSLLGKVESNPVLSLAVIDILGMVIPRTIIDLKRNKEELGGYNWDAARETVLREATTTFILFFFPGLLATQIGKAFLADKYKKQGINTTSFLDFNTLESSKKVMTKVLKDLTDNKSNNGEVSVETLRKNYINAMFDKDNVVSSMKEHSISGFSDGFVKYMNDKDTVYKAVISTENTGKSLKELTKYHREKLLGDKSVDNIANKIKQLTGESKIIYLDNKKTISVDNFLINTASFADDIILRPAMSLIKDATVDIKQSKININDFDNNFKETVKHLENFKKLKLYSVFVSTLALLIAFPRINMLISRLSSGNDNFPGVKGLAATYQDDAGRSKLFLFKGQENKL